MSLIKITIISILTAFLLSALTVMITFQVSPSNSTPIISKVIIWNMYLAKYLIESGKLPGCIDCEMATVIYVIFYGFILGLIGYFLLAFLAVSIFDYKQRNNNQKIRFENK